ncbi:restriction endonuclease subunit S [Halomonas sp. H10-9-1]
MQSGDSISPDHFSESGYPVFGGNGFRGYTATYNREGRLPLIGRQGALCGNINYSEGKFYASEHAIVVTPKEPTAITWLGEAIRSADFNRLSQSTAQPGISVAVIENVHFPLPPTDEQIAISKFIESNFRKIKAAIRIKEKQISLLKERKQILIQNAVTRGLYPDAPMQDSGIEWLGEIPQHWGVSHNRTLFTERVEPGKEGLPLLTVSIRSGVSSGELSEDENLRGRVKIGDQTKYSLVQPGDIVYNMMRAWQGAIGAVTTTGMVSPAYTVAIPDSTIRSKYFEHLYRTPLFVHQMDRHSKGITDFRKRLYWQEFKQMLTLIPPLDEQDHIVHYIDQESTRIDRAISLFQGQIERLKEYRATLIDSAVTGKIRVPGVEDPAPALSMDGPKENSWI